MAKSGDTNGRRSYEGIKKMNEENKIPLYYYRAYRKALRDLKGALEKCQEFLKYCGMNNTKGTIAIIDTVLEDPERLMYSQSLSGYEIPDLYLQKYRKWQKNKKKS